MTEKVMTGTNYVKSKYPEVKSAVEVTLGKQWDKVYKTTMYIPNKAIQITGEVYISAQEMVFAYGQVCVNQVNNRTLEKGVKYVQR